MNSDKTNESLNDKSYNLFLDDVRHPKHCTMYRTLHMPYNLSIYNEEFIIVRNYEEFINVIEQKFKQGEFPRLVSFDHDLADCHYESMNNFTTYPDQFREKTGEDCAKWLVSFCINNEIEMPETLIHSMNSIGANRIQSALNDFEKYHDTFRSASIK